MRDRKEGRYIVQGKVVFFCFWKVVSSSKLYSLWCDKGFRFLCYREFRFVFEFDEKVRLERFNHRRLRVVRMQGHEVCIKPCQNP